MFFCSYKLIQLEKNFWFLVGTAVLLRFIFIVSLPNLSQDFYRFIWDGRMLLSGWNPYLYLPEELISVGTSPIAQAGELYEGMGELSGGNYTNYPPLNQLIFALSGLIAGKSILGSVIVLRFVIIAADIGILHFGKKLLESFGLPGKRIFWYLLNPLVIIELTGNLHFEGVMIFFLVLSLYLLQKHQWISGAIMFAASVLIKLIPLMFLPLLLRFFIKPKKGEYQGYLKFISYCSVVGIIVAAAFLPFVSSGFISNFSGSIALWFQKFEFNAGIYYVIRWLGYQVKGYNIIETAGKVLPVVVILILAGLVFFRKNNSIQELITIFLFGITTYFFLSTTVHPWYIITPLFLSIFTRYRFMMVWSFVVILSYSAYSNPEFRENLWLVAVEYLVVFTVFIVEVFRFEKSEWIFNRKNLSVP